MRGVSFLGWMLSGYLLWLFIVPDPSTGKSWIYSMGDLLIAAKGSTGPAAKGSPTQTYLGDLMGIL